MHFVDHFMLIVFAEVAEGFVGVDKTEGLIIEGNLTHVSGLEVKSDALVCGNGVGLLKRLVGDVDSIGFESVLSKDDEWWTNSTSTAV